MKILSINPAMASKTNFKGLWGKETTECISESFYDHAQMCDMGTNHTITTKVYYPFKDETDKFIASVVKKNQKTDSYTADSMYDVSDNIHEYKVKVMPRLDITEDEYNKYRNDDLLSAQENKIDDMLKLIGLKEHLLRNKRR